MRPIALFAALTGCAPTTDVDEPPADVEWEVFSPAARLRLSTRDFRSNFRVHPKVPMYGLPVFADRGPTLSVDLSDLWSADADHVALIQALRTGISLDSVDDGPVDIEVRDGWFDLDGAGGTASRPALSAVPKGPVPDGWYVMKADISAAASLGLTAEILEGPNVENTLYARVYLGDRPHWYAVDADCRATPEVEPPLPSSIDGRTCFFSIRLTQVVDAAYYAKEASNIELLFDGQSAPCAAQEARSPGENALVVACSEPVDGTLATVKITSDDLVDPTGAPGGQVLVSLDQASMLNRGGAQDPIWTRAVEPFADLGL